MGKSATASISYGFIVPQSEVLELLQKLQNSTEEVKGFGYGGNAELLQELLYEHLKQRGLGEHDFDMVYLTSGEEEFNGLAILYNKIADGENVTVWGLGSQKFEPFFSGPWDSKNADAAFERLSEDSLFKELEIEVDPEWLLGCDMDY